MALPRTALFEIRLIFAYPWLESRRTILSQPILADQRFIIMRYCISLTNPGGTDCIGFEASGRTNAKVALALSSVPEHACYLDEFGSPLRHWIMSIPNRVCYLLVRMLCNAYLHETCGLLKINLTRPLAPLLHLLLWLDELHVFHQRRGRFTAHQGQDAGTGIDPQREHRRHQHQREER